MNRVLAATFGAALFVATALGVTAVVGDDGADGVEHAGWCSMCLSGPVLER